VDQHDVSCWGSQMLSTMTISNSLAPSFLRCAASSRYMRSYDGLGLDTFVGNALFVGSTFYARFSEHAWVSAAWNA
ncbi:MAG: hypothetical protein JWQ49_2405, partial [Edaphobacter sp.]|nr:hypothetical protein [Edaphobacter sp.]